jgi:hypothetical protein
MDGQETMPSCLYIMAFAIVILHLPEHSGLCGQMDHNVSPFGCLQVEAAAVNDLGSQVVIFDVGRPRLQCGFLKSELLAHKAVFAPCVTIVDARI